MVGASAVSLATVVHKAPGLHCTASCTVPGFELSPLDNGLVKFAVSPPRELLDPRLPADLAACLWHLSKAYSTCGQRKQDADTDFAVCVSGPANIEELPAWWFGNVRRMKMLSEKEVGELSAKLDCEVFMELQHASCECSASATSVRSLEQLAAGGTHMPFAHVLSLPARGAQMACIGKSIGDQSDSAVTNAVSDRIGVTARLIQLGFLDASSAASPRHLEHALRVFSCALDEEGTFEHPCDLMVPGACQVDGVLCERATERRTCLSVASCAEGRVVPSGKVHRWLRSTMAPQWGELPEEGVGYQVVLPHGAVGTPNPVFGTSWLRNALALAGKLYAQDAGAASPPLKVTEGAPRFGGSPAGDGLQTGRALTVELPGSPVNENVAAAQLKALRAAGLAVSGRRAAQDNHFQVWHVDTNIPDEAAPRVPLIQSAQMDARTDETPGASVKVELVGSDFGTGWEDVLAVGVGATSCLLMEHSFERVLLQCDTSKRGELRGSAWLMTLSGGAGFGCSDVSAPMDRQELVHTGERAAAAIRTAVAEPAAALLVHSRELEQRMSGVIEGWRDIGNMPPTAGDQSHLVTDILPNTLASMDKLIAHAPAIRAVSTAASRTTTSLETLALDASELLSDQCLWAFNVRKSAASVLERLPFVNSARAVIDPLRERMDLLDDAFEGFQDFLSDIRASATEVRAKYAYIQSETAHLKPELFRELVLAQEVLRNNTVDPWEQIEAASRMRDFISATLIERLKTFKVQTPAVRDAAETIIEDILNARDAIASADANEGWCESNEDFCKTNTEEGKTVLNLETIEAFIRSAQKRMLEWSEPEQYKDYSALRSTKRLVKTAQAMVDTAYTSIDMLNAVADALSEAMTLGASALEIHGAFAGLVPRVDEAIEVVKKMREVPQVIAQVEELMGDFEPTIMTTIAASAETLASDAWDTLFPDWLDAALAKFRSNIAASLSLLGRIEKVVGSDEMLLHYVQQAASLTGICAAGKSVAGAISMGDSLTTAGPIIDATFQAITELRTELSIFVGADAVPVTGAKRMASALLLLIETQPKVNQLTDWIERWMVLDTRTSELVAVAASAVEVANTHQVELTVASSWARKVWSTPSPTSLTMADHLGHGMCAELAVRGSSAAKPSWFTDPCSVGSANDGALGERWGAENGAAASNNVALMLASRGPSAAALLYTLRTSITTQMAMAKESVADSTTKAMDLCRAAIAPLNDRWDNINRIMVASSSALTSPTLPESARMVEANLALAAELATYMTTAIAILNPITYRPPHRVISLRNAVQDIGFPQIAICEGETIDKNDVPEVTSDRDKFTDPAVSWNDYPLPETVQGLILEAGQEGEDFAKQMKWASVALAGIPPNLLQGLSHNLCLLERTMASIEHWVPHIKVDYNLYLDYLRLGGKAFAERMEKDFPDGLCQVHPPFCLDTHRESPDGWYNKNFPLRFLTLWDRSGRPMLDICDEGDYTPHRRTIPGLLSNYSIQSSTFLSREVGGPAGFSGSCVQFRHLLSYSPLPSATCPEEIREPRGALLVRTGHSGKVHIVHKVLDPLGKPYEGAFTGMAVSLKHNRIYACGQYVEGHAFEGAWFVAMFNYDDMLTGLDAQEEIREGNQFDEARDLDNLMDEAFPGEMEEGKAYNFAGRRRAEAYSKHPKYPINRGEQATMGGSSQNKEGARVGEWKFRGRRASEMDFVGYDEESDDFYNLDGTITMMSQTPLWYTHPDHPGNGAMPDLAPNDVERCTLSFQSTSNRLWVHTAAPDREAMEPDANGDIWAAGFRVASMDKSSGGFLNYKHPLFRSPICSEEYGMEGCKDGGAKETGSIFEAVGLADSPEEEDDDDRINIEPEFAKPMRDKLFRGEIDMTSLDIRWMNMGEIYTTGFSFYADWTLGTYNVAVNECDIFDTNQGGCKIVFHDISWYGEDEDNVNVAWGDERDGDMKPNWYKAGEGFGFRENSPVIYLLPRNGDDYYYQLEEGPAGFGADPDKTTKSVEYGAEKKQTARDAAKARSAKMDSAANPKFNKRKSNNAGTSFLTKGADYIACADRQAAVDEAPKTSAPRSEGTAWGSAPAEGAGSTKADPNKMPAQVGSRFAKHAKTFPKKTNFAPKSEERDGFSLAFEWCCSLDVGKDDEDFCCNALGGDEDPNQQPPDKGKGAGGAGGAGSTAGAGGAGAAGRRRMQSPGAGAAPEPAAPVSAFGALPLATEIGSLAVPTGIGSLTMEANILDGDPVSEFFHATFIGQRMEYRDSTKTLGDDPEDRVIDFRAPILITGYTKSADEIDVLVLFIFHLLGQGREIFDSCYYPSYVWVMQPPKVGRMLGDGSDPLETGSAGSDVPDDVAGDDVLYEVSYDALHEIFSPEDRAAAKRAGASDQERGSFALHRPQFQHRRRMEPQFRNQLDRRGRRLEHAWGGEHKSLFDNAENDVCIPIELEFFDAYRKLFLFEISFFVNLALVIGVSGGFSLGLYINTILAGDICLLARKVTIGPEFTLILVLTAFIAGEIPKIIRGGFEMAIQILKLSLHLILGVGLKAGPVIGFKVVLKLGNPILTISAFVDVIWIEFCKVGFLPLPCGFSWKNLMSFPFIEIPLIPDMDEDWETVLFEDQTDPKDDTPPTAGLVSIYQVNASHIKIETSGFVDEDTEIERFSIEVYGNGVKMLFFEDKADPSILEDKLSPEPTRSLYVQACATAYNEVALSSTTCSEHLLWDHEPPYLLSMKLRDPISGKMQNISHDRCGFNRTLEDGTWFIEDYLLHECKTPFYTSETSNFEFEATVADDLVGGMNFAAWSLESIQCGTYWCPKDTLSPDKLQPLTTALNKLRVAAPLVVGKEGGGTTISFTTSALAAGTLIQGQTVYLHLYLCDLWYNCGTSHGYPIFVDRTIVEPPYMVPDASRNTSADYETFYFVSPHYVAPHWNTVDFDWEAYRDGELSLKYQFMMLPYTHPSSLVSMPYLDNDRPSPTSAEFHRPYWFTWRISCQGHQPSSARPFPILPCPSSSLSLFASFFSCLKSPHLTLRQPSVLVCCANRRIPSRQWRTRRGCP